MTDQSATVQGNSLHEAQELRRRLRDMEETNALLLQSASTSAVVQAELNDAVAWLPQTFFEADTELNVTYLNHTGYAAFGLSPDALARGLPLVELVTPGDRGRACARFARALHGTAAPCELGCVRSDGEVFPAMVYTSRVIRKGEVVALRGFIIDITERIKAEQQLREAEANYRTLVEQLPAITYIVDLGEVHRTTFISPQVEELLGFRQAEWLSDPELWIRRLHPDDREAVLAETARTEETCEPFSMEHRFVTRDGDVLWVQNSAVYMCDENGRPTYMHGVMFDITPRMTVESERSLLREQLVQSQKMEAVGKLAGGVAHDFNNLLTVIQGHAQQAMMQVSETGPFHAILSKINSAAERAADLTRKLLLFSRKQPVDFRILNLNAVITDLVKMLHRLIGEDVTIETGLADDPWTIRADQNSIEQMIMNLAVNARDAMPQGGTLTVRTANVVCGAEEVRGTDGAQPGPYVMLTVSDTGVGMTEKVLGRVFEPFFTTKSAGQGTGLGLSVVYGIVQQHNAFVRVRSTLGEGTTFRIWFPAVSEPQDEPEREGLAQLSTNGEGQRILLIEDEDHVRDMVRLVLEKNGYKVITAATVRDAVEQFAAYGGEFVLAFSDIILPDGNGLQLVDHLRERRPQLDVLLTSGYTGEKLQLHEIQQRGYRFLQKPYNVTELLRAVSELATQ